MPAKSERSTVTSVEGRVSGVGDKERGSLHSTLDTLLLHTRPSTLVSFSDNKLRISDKEENV
jgi:hypothetical protein